MRFSKPKKSIEAPPPTRGARSLAELVGPEPKKRKGVVAAKPAAIAATMGEAALMKAADDFSEAEPRHVVALYALLHRAVYGVEPAELRAAEWTLAVMAVRRLVDREFDGSVPKLVELLRWTWRREIRAHARANGSERRRIGWRLQFSPSLVTDYRVHMVLGRSAKAKGSGS